MCRRTHYSRVLGGRPTHCKPAWRFLDDDQIAKKENSRKSLCRISDKLEPRRRDSSSEPQPHRIPWPLTWRRAYRCASLDTAPQVKKETWHKLLASGTLSLHQDRLHTFSHPERAARSQCEAVPKAPKAS